MSGFAASYYRESNDEWLNTVVGEIIGPHHNSRRVVESSQEDNHDPEDNLHNCTATQDEPRNSLQAFHPEARSHYGSVLERLRSTSRHSRSSRRSYLPGYRHVVSPVSTRDIPTPDVLNGVNEDQKENKVTIHRPRPSVQNTLPRSSIYSDKTIVPPESSLIEPEYQQGWFKGNATLDLARKPSQGSTASSFKGFQPHPAVRPLESRAALGEAAGPQSDDDAEYPNPAALTMIIIGICLSVFTISLDRNIVTTAIPEITEQFHSYSDIGWYGSGYLLTASAFQPLYGRIYMSFDTKSTFLGALAIFEVGSLIGALAPASGILIFGRALQGLGSAGILTGSFVVGTHSVRIQKRPILFAAVGILYSVGALCGPLLGGAFTDTIGWRWCFWINLPIGGITFVAVFFCFKRKHGNKSGKPKDSFINRIVSLDVTGNILLLGACTMLFMALQYSEEQYSWSSTRVVGLLVGFGIATLIFISWMIFRGEKALIPPRIIRQRTVAASCGAAFFIYGATLIHAYYLPIWFQAIKGDQAIVSGIHMIPYMLGNALFSILAGIFVSKNGLFAPPSILGTAIGAIGSGLLATFEPKTSTAMWIGYEVLTACGLGMAIQQGFNAVQTALPIEEVPIGTAAVVASQSAGGAIFVSVGNTLLQNHLLNQNNANVIPGVDIRSVIELGATVFRSHVPASSLPALLALYNDALAATFMAAMALCSVAFICSCLMEFRSFKQQQVREDSAKNSSKKRKAGEV